MDDTMTFVSTTSNPQETISLTIKSNSLVEVVGAFERFLRGAGYCFEGNLEIVKNIEITANESDHF
ncbi:MAG: hypothetical protein ACK42H_19355 [Planctomycetota bacterium]|jgi:hypothetical protein